MAEGSNYVIAILLDAKDKNLKTVLESAGHQVEDFTDKAETSGSRIEKAFMGAGMAMAFGKAIPFMKQSIGLFNQATSAASGLQSAIKASGEDWEQAHAFLKAYTEDGLVPLTQASASLKNLLAGGYGLEESMGIMRTMKDYAAYGRQGQLSMGDAIERTTQGLKAQLSSLTDNAGWTKNLAIAHKEYAALIGTTVGKLTEAEKRTANYVAIMKDGVAVQGAAAKASDELTGKLARQQARIRTMGEAVGEGLAPSYERLLDTLGPVTDGVTAFAKANPEATATLLGGAGLVAAVGALAAVLALVGLPGAIVVGVLAGIVALSAAIVQLISGYDRAAESTAEYVAAKRTEETRVRELAKEYGELKDKAERTAEEEERLRDVTQELIEKIPTLKGFTVEQAMAYRDVAEEAGAYADELDRIAVHGTMELQLEYAQWSLKMHDAMGGVRKYEELLESMKQAQEDPDLDQNWVEQVVASFEESLKGYNTELTEAEANTERLLALLAAAGAEPFAIIGGGGGAGGGGGGAGGPEELEDEIEGGAGADAEERTEDVYGLLDALRELSEWSAEQQGIPPSLLFPPETMEEAVQQYLDYMNWIEELRDEAAERDEERDAATLEKKRAALEAYYRTAKGKIDQLVKEWDDLSNVGVRALQQTADMLGASLGTILSGTEDMAEKLQQIWGSFTNWLWMELARIIARLIMAAVLKSFLGGPSIGSLDIVGEVGGTALGQTGGRIPGPTRGYDYVPTLLDGGELVLNTDLTRRMERFVGNWEAGSSPSPAMAVAQGEGFAEPAGETHYHFHSADYPSFARALRSGELGRELGRALRHGRLAR